MTELKLDQVEGTLAKLWDAAQSKSDQPPARLRTVNIVAVCTLPAQRAVAFDAVRALLPLNPGRAIVAVLSDPGDPPGITASAELVVGPRGGDEPVGELVGVYAIGSAARAWVPGAIERLISPAVPVFLWWLGDLPDDDTVYDRLTETADVIAVNSADMDLRDLGTLSHLAREAGGRYALADLGWLRLRAWQELLARFFDDPAVRPRLANARSLTITASPHRSDAFDEPTSTQAGLFAGWFASRVGAKTDAAQWTTSSGEVREVVVPRASGEGTLALRFRTEARAGMVNGALLRVALETDDGARFEVGRQDDDPLVLGWSGECSGAVIPHAVVRVRKLDELELLSRWLESPLRDRLFEASLGAASGLIAPIRPQPSRT